MFVCTVYSDASSLLVEILLAVDEADREDCISRLLDTIQKQTCTLSIYLLTYVLRIDALDQWCLRRILGFKWSDFVRNEDVHHATRQPPLSSIVKTRRLSLFGHIAQMNELTDASRILFEPPSEVWTKPRGQPRNSWVRTVTNDLANSYTGLPEAREAAQDRVYWRMFTKHSATHS